MEKTLINAFCDNAKSHIIELERIVSELEKMWVEKQEINALNTELKQLKTLFYNIKK